MQDANDSKALSFFFCILIIITITFLGACGKDPKTGATDSSSKFGTSTIPNSTGNYSGNLYNGGTSSGGSLSDLSNPDIKSTLDKLLGSGTAGTLLNSLLGLQNPTTLQGMANTLANAIPLLQLVAQAVDPQTKQEFVSLLNYIAQEVQNLKQNFSIDRVKAFAKDIISRIVSIIRSALARKAGNG